LLGLCIVIVVPNSSRSTSGTKGSQLSVHLLQTIQTDGRCKSTKHLLQTTEPLKY
jgi:hypothetical protein